jgi:hypothetical protein
MDRLLNIPSQILNSLTNVNKFKESENLFKNEHARLLRKDDRDLKTKLSDLEKQKQQFLVNPKALFKAK